MYAGQTLVDEQDNQIALFPLSVMNITQGENGSYSHMGSLAIDFIGTTTNYPYYAPFNCTLKWKASDGSGYIYQSNSPVRWVNGLISYACIYVGHDDNGSYTVGRQVNQGQLLGHTGTAGNVTGDHVHIEVSVGEYQGMTENSQGVWVLVNQVSMRQLFDIRDTTIINNGGYTWSIYDGGVTPPSGDKAPYLPVYFLE